MSLILNVDTATEVANISIAENGVVLSEAFNHDQKDHAGFLQPAIKNIAAQTGVELKELDAIAVNFGPGSYTGLRVGMASAKGLCYALNKPLICIDSLEIIAKSVQLQFRELTDDPDVLICPMIDARRMEVFTAMYKNDLSLINSATAIILDENPFITFLQKNKIIFAGSGSEKFKKLVSENNAIFCQIIVNSQAICALSSEKLLKSAFSDLAYTEPNYIKQFYTN